jgi:hypothetical protein
VFRDCYGALVCLPDGILPMLGNGKVYYGLLERLETGLLLITENLMALLTVAVLSRLKCLETVTGH